VGVWDRIAVEPPRFDSSGYYHDRLVTLYRSLIRPGLDVIELGCGPGDLLAAVEPRRGVGVDFSRGMIALARARHPDLDFRHADVHDVSIDETFDVVILSDLINDLWDVQAVLDRVTRLCKPETRIIVNFYSRLWQGPLSLARRLGMAKPVLSQNWLSRRDVENLLRLSGFEVVSATKEILLPVSVPLLATIFNRFLAKLWPIDNLGLTQFVVARLDPARFGPSVGPAPSVSVVIPARNEAGHIRDILERTPRMGSRTELLFVEGNSTDGTFEVITKAVEELGDPDVRVYRQSGVGKGDAVRLGFEQASGDILMILDADMTVAPEDLPRFYRAIVSGTGEFVNGVRLVYPMEKEAMRFLNYLGNRFFGLLFSWLLRQPVRDTLCGTKVLTRKAYDDIASGRSYFGDFDPFGDFDLLFGAARNSLKIVDVPIRYRERTYGSTNIDRWRHGVLLLKMAGFAARRIRFL
jgi:SAM-dependent methyltransferase